MRERTDNISVSHPSAWPLKACNPYSPASGPGILYCPASCHCGLQTPGGSQLLKFCPPLGLDGSVCCGGQQGVGAAGVQLQVKSVRFQTPPGSADPGNSLHVDPFGTWKNGAASLFHTTCGTSCFRKENEFPSDLIIP